MNPNEETYSLCEFSVKPRRAHTQTKSVVRLPLYDVTTGAKIMNWSNSSPATARCSVTGYVPGTLIRDAITGVTTPYRVGTRDEDYFFKVCLATGALKNHVSNHLYFDSPHQYMQHCHVHVSDAIQQKWYAKAASHEAKAGAKSVYRYEDDDEYEQTDNYLAEEQPTDQHVLCVAV